MTLILSGSNGVSDVDGTAATPAIRGTDANTGIFFPAADTLGASVGGSEGLRLTSTGLGIGTSTIQNASSGRGNITLGGTSSAIFNLSVNSANSGSIYHTGTEMWFHNRANGPALFFTNDTERMRLDSSGNLGLGVTPSAWSQGKAFEISAVGEGLWGNGLGDIWMLNGAYFNGGFKYSGSTKATAYRQGAGVADGSHSWHVAGTGTAGNAITFTQAMTLDASGNLGLGATSVTSSRFQIKGANNSTAAYADGLRVTSNNETVETQYSWAGINANDSLKLATGGTERARIDSSGNLLVGTTSAGAGNSRTYLNGDGTNPALRVLANTATTSVYAGVFRHESTTSGAYIQFVTDSNVETGRIYDSAGTMQYASSSDARLKTNVQTLQNGLNSVLALHPCTYEMRRGETTTIPSAGLIAQEVYEVYPYAVGVGGDDENTNPWSVDYGKLTPVLIKAIQEQQAIITALTERVAALEAK